MTAEDGSLVGVMEPSRNGAFRLVRPPIFTVRQAHGFVEPTAAWGRIQGERTAPSAPKCSGEESPVQATSVPPESNPGPNPIQARIQSKPESNPSHVG